RLRPPLFALERTLRLFPRRLPQHWPLMCGSQFWALTSDCARHCLEFARSRPDMVRFFRTVFAPDEIFFHSVVQNSRFAAEAEPPEPFTEEVTKIGSLAPYASLHYILAGRLISSADDALVALARRPGKLFARKFSSSASSSALRVIDQHLEGAEIAQESRATV